MPVQTALVPQSGFESATACSESSAAAAPGASARKVVAIASAKPDRVRARAGARALVVEPPFVPCRAFASKPILGASTFHPIKPQSNEDDGKGYNTPAFARLRVAGDVDVIVGTFFLAAAALHGCVAFLVLSARPRPKSWWLLLLLVSLSGGSAFARAWWAFSPAAGADGWFHRVTVDLEWPLSFVALAIAISVSGKRIPPRVTAVAAAVLGAAWLVVVLEKDVLYGQAPWGYPVETDWRAFAADRVRYYVTMGAALLALGSAWARSPSSNPLAGLLLVAFAFGPLQAAPELWIQGASGGNASAYEWASDFTQLAGPALLAVICFVSVLRAARSAPREALRIGTWLLVALASGLVSLLARSALQAETLPGFGEIGYLIVRPGLFAFAFAAHGFGEGPVRVPAKLGAVTAALLSGLAFLPPEEILRRFAPVSAELAMPLGVAAGLAASATCFLLVSPSLRGGTARRPAQLAGRFSVVRHLGSGASGSTLECVDALDGSRVAVKVIPTNGDASVKERALRESTLQSQLKGPHLVPFRSAIALPHEVLIVMDLAEGGSLAATLRAAPAGLSPATARRIVGDVLKGLQVLHDAGVTHGDVKPSNVLLARDSRAMLSDFGIARRSEAATSTGLAGSGTPAYMAPETLLGNAPDPRCDTFSTGILLHECLVGRPPARRWTSNGVEQESASAAGLPRWARDYIEATTSPSPASRPRNATEALARLERASAGFAEKEETVPQPDHVS